MDHLAVPPFQELTTISASQPFSKQCDGNKCPVAGYFDIWINETSSNVFSQTSRKKLYQKASYTNWYDVFYYVKLWWTEVIKRIYYLTNNFYESIQTDPVVYAEVIEEEEPLFESVVENIQSTTSSGNFEKIFQFFLLYCIIGGIFLIFFLIKRTRVKTKRRNEDLLSSTDVKEIETNVVQKLIKILKETKNIDDNFQKNFETNYCTFSDTIKSYEKKQKFKIKKDLPEKSGYKDSNQINKLERQCKIYQNQIRVLEQQLQDLLKNHRTEVKNYFIKNRKIEYELGKSQNLLDVSHKLHKTEAGHLHEYISHLTAQYETIENIDLDQLRANRNNFQVKEKNCIQPENNSFRTFKRLTYQGNPEEIKKHPTKVNEVCRHVQRNITKLPSPHNGNINKTNPKSSQDIRNQLESTGKFDIKSEDKFTNLNQPESTTGSTLRESRLLDQNLTDEIGANQKCNDEEFLNKPLHMTEPQLENIIDIVNKPNNNKFNKTPFTHSDRQNVYVNIQEIGTKSKETLKPIINNNKSFTVTSKNVNQQEMSKQTEPIVKLDPTTNEMLNKIERIFSETKKLKNQVKEFKGIKDDPSYLHLNGMLIEHAIQLNNIQCESKPIVKKNIKKVWKYVCKCREVLENKVNK